MENETLLTDRHSKKTIGTVIFLNVHRGPNAINTKSPAQSIVQPHTRSPGQITEVSRSITSKCHSNATVTKVIIPTIKMVLSVTWKPRKERGGHHSGYMYKRNANFLAPTRHPVSLCHGYGLTLRDKVEYYIFFCGMVSDLQHSLSQKLPLRCHHGHKILVSFAPLNKNRENKPTNWKFIFIRGLQSFFSQNFN